MSISISGYAIGIFDPYNCNDVDKNTSCFECPYGDCIRNLRYHEKELIHNADRILFTYKMFDEGSTVKEICNVVSTSSSNVRHWIRNRIKITKKLKRYALRGLTIDL